MTKLPAFVVLFALAATLLMADKRIIRPKGSSPAGPYSPGILIDGTLYAARQVGRADFEAEVKQCLDNVHAILDEAGMGFNDAVSAQIYLTDMYLFARMNTVYMSYFPEPRPARTTVGVSKLVGTRIEITVTARKDRPPVQSASGGSL